jgi:hypothetical protein
MHLLSVFLLFLFIFFACSINLPDSFEADIIIQYRVNEEKIFYTKLQKNGISHTVIMKEADNGMIHYFQNGKFFTQDSAKGICNDEVFSVNAVFKAIETSTPLSNNTIIFDKELSKRCKLLAKHITKYEGESFVICTEGNNIQYIISRDLLITVKSITKLRNKFAVPPQLPQCKTVEVTSGPIQERMPWFKDEKTSCSLSWTKDESVCSPFMNLPKKRCVFIHGSGNKVVGPPAFGEWPRYWVVSL